MFLLNGQHHDQDSAQYRAYASIEERMENDYFVDSIPTVLLVEYLSPLPLAPPPPLVVGSEAVTPSPVEVISSTTAADRLTLSPWTIGACVATVMGGVVSLLVWGRNRRARHRRHMYVFQEQTVVQSASRNPVEI